MSRQAVLRVVCFLMGFFSLGVQGLLFREHLLIYSGNELGTGVFLGAWMFWVGVGGLCGVFVKRPSVRFTGLVCLLYPAALVVQLAVLWHLRHLAGISPLEPFGLDMLVVCTAAACFPVSWVTGFSFTVLAVFSKPALESSRIPVAVQVYGLEALGALVSGLLVTILLYLGVEVLVVLGGLVCVWALGTSLFGWRYSRWVIAGLGIGFTIGAAVVVSVLVIGPGQWGERVRLMRESAVPISSSLTVVEQVDTPYQHLTVVRAGTSLSIYSDGELVDGIPDEAGSQLTASVLYAMHPAASRVLVVGLSPWQLMCSLLLKPDVELTYVTVDRQFDLGVKRHLPESMERCVSSASLETVYEDPVVFLRESAGRRHFDLVVLAVGHPTTARTARFFTVEFYRLVQGVLSETGLMSVAVRGAQNTLAGEALGYVATVYKTLGVVFSSVAMSSDAQVRFFAGNAAGNVTEDGDELARRYEILSGLYPLVCGEDLKAVFDASRLASRRLALEVPGLGRVSSAVAPSVFLLGIEAEGAGGVISRFLSGLGSGAGVKAGLLVLCLFVGYVLWGRGAGCGGRGVLMLSIAAGGFAGMSSQTALLLMFQSVHGAMWIQFGLLNALFMAGLGVGGLVLVCHGPRGRALEVAGLLLALWCGLLGFSMTFRSLPGQWFFWLSCGVLGLLVGWFVGTATGLLEQNGDVSGAAVFLEAFDHFGAMLGALVGGLVLVPFEGGAGALYLGAGLLAAVVGACWLEGRGGLGRADAIPGRPAAVLLGGVVLFLAVAALVDMRGRDGKQGGRPLEGTSVSLELPEAGADPERGFALRSSDYAIDAGGWGGAMEVVAVVDGRGRLVRVRLGRHHETPEYVWGINDWLDSFSGKDPLKLAYGVSDQPDGVDGLTGATVTGRAVVRIVRAAAAARSGIPEATVSAGVPAEESAWPDWLKWCGLVALFASGIVLYLTGRRGPYRCFLLVVVVCSGIVWNSQLALDSLLMSLWGLLPPAGNVASWLLLGGVAVTLVLCGPLYCGYLCPAGAASELLSGVGLKLAVPAGLDGRLRRFRFFLALLLVVLTSTIVGRDILRGDPLSFVFLLKTDAFALLLAAGLLGGALVFYRPYCRYLCPVGAILSLCEPLAALNRWIPRRLASRCHLAVRPGTDLDCIRCNRCVGERSSFYRENRWVGPLLVVWMLVMLGAWYVRGTESPVVAAAPPAAPQEVRSHQTVPGSKGPDAAGEPDVPDEHAGPTLEQRPGLVRKDDEPYPVQRSLAPGAVRHGVERGLYSGEEALFYLPVQENPGSGPAH